MRGRREDLRVNFTNKEIVTAFPASCKLGVTHVTVLVSVYSPPATISSVTPVTGSRDRRGGLYGWGVGAGAGRAEERVAPTKVFPMSEGYVTDALSATR